MRPIYLFVRHCSSPNLKNRPNWFAHKEQAMANLMQTKDADTHVTLLLDTLSIPDPTQHFSYKYKDQLDQVISMPGGSDACSLYNLVGYITSLKLPDDAIVYLLEDDYLHRPGWTNILREAFDAKLGDYVTLYDHSDKYSLPMYKGLKSELFVTESCHWRNTPSTTNTYAVLFKLLVEKAVDQVRFSDKESGISYDHSKWVWLQEQGYRLISPIPGYSTHLEQEWLAPAFDWRKLIKANLL